MLIGKVKLCIWTDWVVSKNSMVTNFMLVLMVLSGFLALAALS